MDVAARLEVVEVENETLRSRVRELEELLRDHWVAPFELQLTPAEAVCLGFLLKKEMATKAELMSILYGHRIDGGPDQKIVDVFICKLRKKLKVFDLTVTTLWGRGYALPAASKSELKNWEVRT